MEGIANAKLEDRYGGGKPDRQGAHLPDESLRHRANRHRARAEVLPEVLPDDRFFVR
jgi:hypothetical protein